MNDNKEILLDKSKVIRLTDEQIIYTAEVMLDDIIDACEKIADYGVGDFCSCINERMALLDQIPLAHTNKGLRRPQTRNIFLTMKKIFDKSRRSGMIRC